MSEQKQLTDLQQYLVDEFVEDYQHGHMSRRDAFKRIAAVTGSVALAAALLAACGPVPTPTAAPAPTKAPAPATAAPSPTAQATPAPPTATQPPGPATRQPRLC